MRDTDTLDKSGLLENLKASGLPKDLSQAFLSRLLDLLGPEKAMALILFGIIDPDDAAKAFGKDEKTLKNWMARRELPFVPLGNRNVLLWDSMRTWLKAKEIKAHGCN